MEIFIIFFILKIRYEKKIIYSGKDERLKYLNSEELFFKKIVLKHL